MTQLILFLAVVSLVLHTPWELAQTKALSTCAGKPWPIRLRKCSIGIVSDVLYTLGLYYLIGWWHFNEKVSHFPKSLGNVALTPALQLPLLVALTYLLLQWILL
jgi:hypothetical protein